MSNPNSVRHLFSYTINIGTTFEYYILGSQGSQTSATCMQSNAKCPSEVICVIHFDPDSIQMHVPPWVNVFSLRPWPWNPDHIYTELEKKRSQRFTNDFLETSNSVKCSKNIDHRPTETFNKRSIHAFHHKWHSRTKS